MRTDDFDTAVQPDPISMRPPLHSSVWIQRFADCLMLLQPRTIAITAARHVAATCPEACALEPEEAAARFVFEEPGPRAGKAH